ncbi:MAG: hypothetical protein EZS28_002198, partial [Streblomastix strix]
WPTPQTSRGSGGNGPSGNVSQQKRKNEAPNGDIHTLSPQGGDVTLSLMQFPTSTQYQKKKKVANKMQTEQQIQDVASLIIQFNDSYAQNKQGKQKEQPESESNPQLTDIVSTLLSLQHQIEVNRSCYQVIQIPKILQSLSALVTFRLGTYIDLDVDRQSLEVRSWNRWCFNQIQRFGDEQDQQELVNNEYGRVMSLSLCTAGGAGEEQDEEIRNGLYYIYDFLRQLHEGRNDQPSFQHLPLLAGVSLEQMKEEGAIEELEAQMINSGYDGEILDYANDVKAATLNRFIN